MSRELVYTELKRFCDASDLGFDTTEKLVPCSSIIGQERAAKSLNFGLNVKMKGYNIFVSGQSGTGKTYFTRKFAEEVAKNEKTPPDLCYVYNFKDPKHPRLLKLENGQAKVFKEDMDEFISLLSVEIPRIFSAKDFESQKNSIVKTYQDKRDDIIKEITEDAKAQNFGVKMTSTGIYFMPRIDGELISEEQFDALPDNEKEKITTNSESIQEKAMTVMQSIKEFDKCTRKEIEDLEYNIGLFTIGHHISNLQSKYQHFPAVLEYLEYVKEDILENMGDFLSEPEGEEEEYLQTIVPWASKRSKDEFLSKYKINVIADNSSQSGAPVVMSFNPTYTNLIGEIEFDSEFGNFTTDFMKIKPGLLHRANGGYLILQAYDVLTTPHVWETLRRIIRTGEIIIEPLREYSAGIAVATIRPESIEVDVKIIMIGSHYYYELLSMYDDDFMKYFKINAVFDYEFKYSSSSLSAIACFIKKFVLEQSTLDFEASAVAKVIEHSVRLAENQNKLTSSFNKLQDILVESAAWAKIDNAKIISRDHVKKAIDEKDYRLNVYEEKLSEMIESNIIMIDTKGQKVGQVNGLAVLDTGDYVFAKPTRITATAYLGKAGIVNVEKEAELSGEIHDKGVQIIIGYLGQTYAQDFPLSLSCRICFEQNYSGIDGDSASSTELYAILSSLSDLPLSQEMAVTGSINQRGEIQAIGGVTYKVEGFFDLCNKRGLTGKQGVIIPEQNVADLTLRDDVIEAVKSGDFHIYAIKHINEGIKILTGVDAGERNEKGKFPSNSVHGRVYKKLKDYNKKTRAEM